MKKLISEATNSPVSFVGGVIAICGLLYSLYVFVLNGDFPSLPFGNHVFKFLILIALEAPLAYFFVQVHISMAEKGHGLPLFLNLLTIIISALISCFNVSILSYQSLLSGSVAYYVIMVIFSFFCASYLLIIEINRQKTKSAYVLNLDALDDFTNQTSVQRFRNKLSSVRGRLFPSLKQTNASLNEVLDKDDSEFKAMLKLVKKQKIDTLPSAWEGWILTLLVAYACAFIYCSISVFPDIYSKACIERSKNGESLDVLNNYNNNCDGYINLAKE